MTGGRKFDEETLVWLGGACIDAREHALLSRTARGLEPQVGAMQHGFVTATREMPLADSRLGPSKVDWLCS